MSNDGATPDRKDVNETATNDPCIRFRLNAEGGHDKIAMGKHAWQWKDLLVMRVCSTCGVERPFKGRFLDQ